MTIVSGDNVTITAQTRPYTYYFPSTPAGSSVSRAFTFYNNTPQNFVALSVYSYTLTQVQGNCFSLIAGSFPASIDPGSPEAFRWRMLSGVAGTCQATISFQTNKSIYPTFSWTLAGTVTP